jgi:hypothetical protein
LAASAPHQHPQGRPERLAGQGVGLVQRDRHLAAPGLVLV